MKVTMNCIYMCVCVSMCVWYMWIYICMWVCIHLRVCMHVSVYEHGDQKVTLGIFFLLSPCCLLRHAFCWTWTLPIWATWARQLALETLCFCFLSARTTVFWHTHHAWPLCRLRGSEHQSSHLNKKYLIHWVTPSSTLQT